MGHPPETQKTGKLRWARDQHYETEHKRKRLDKLVSECNTKGSSILGLAAASHCHEPRNQFIHPYMMLKSITAA